MKSEQEITDNRIEQFIKQKMLEFPEIQEEYSPRIKVVRRKYAWTDFMSPFKDDQRV